MPGYTKDIPVRTGKCEATGVSRLRSDFLIEKVRVPTCVTHADDKTICGIHNTSNLQDEHLDTYE